MGGAAEALVDFDEFGAAEDDEGGIIDPDEEEDHGAGGAEGAEGAAAAEIPGEAELADFEEEGGDEGAGPDIAPGELQVWEDFEDEGEEEELDGEGDGEGEKGPGFHGEVEIVDQPAAQDGESAGDEDREEEEGAGGEDHGEGEEAVAEEVGDAAAGAAAEAPDEVEGVFEFDEDAGGAVEEGGAADQGGGGIVAVGQGDAAHELLEGGGGLFAHEAGELEVEFALDGLGAEDLGDGGHGEQKQGGHGKEGEVGDGGALAGQAIVVPGVAKGGDKAAEHGHGRARGEFGGGKGRSCGGRGGETVGGQVGQESG